MDKKLIARLIGIYTGGSFNLWVLTGSAKRSVRKHIMETILGRKPEVKELGVTFLRDTCFQVFEIPMDCNAVRERNLELACRKLLGE